MKYATRVQHADGRTGTVCPDQMSCCEPGEVAVVYDGLATFEGTDPAHLTDLGPENAAPDLAKCGAGCGADCCIFLTFEGAFLACQRFTAMRWTMVMRTMTAKRHPSEPYPACMNQNGVGAEPVEAA